MAYMIRMKHPAFDHDWTEYFYDGELTVTKGVVEVPSERPEWAQRLWILGFMQTPEGVQITNIIEHIDVLKAQDAKEIDASEGADAGRQPNDQDGVRTSPAKGSRSVPKRRVGSRRSNSARSRA